MPVLPLAALLSLLPPALEPWASRVCPPAKQTPTSSTERKLMEQQHAQCLREAMERGLDKALQTLKRSHAEAVPEGQALQEQYSRWVQEACAAVEEASWVDPATGERTMGTGYGFTASECLQRQYAWRGLFVEAWARGDWRGVKPVFQDQGPRAGASREALRAYQEAARRTAARAPARVEGAGLPQRKLSQTDWKPYLERLERTLAGPEQLARRQCALTPAPAPGEDCVARLADSLVALLDFPSPPAPRPPAPAPEP